MENRAMVIKGIFSGVIAFLTALWGWFGWLVVGWLFLMALDYLTGSRVALKNGEWTSEAAYSGLWRKGVMIIVVICAGVLDLIIGAMLNNVPGVALPFTYSVLACPLVLLWYILTELGSILENVLGMGANVPPFLVKLVKGLKASVSRAGDKLGGGEGEDDAVR